MKKAVFISIFMIIISISFSQNKKVVVIGSDVVLHESPSSESEIVMKLSKFDTLEVFSQKESWIEVCISDTCGWSPEFNFIYIESIDDRLKSSEEIIKQLQFDSYQVKTITEHPYQSLCTSIAIICALSILAIYDDVDIKTTKGIAITGSITLAFGLIYYRNHEVLVKTESDKQENP